jgi:hypothetical protein
MSARDSLTIEHYLALIAAAHDRAFLGQHETGSARARPANKTETKLTDGGADRRTRHKIAIVRPPGEPLKITLKSAQKEPSHAPWRPLAQDR